MGRLLIALATLCAIAVYFAGKPNDAPTTHQQTAPNQGVASLTPKDNYESGGHTESARDKSPDKDASSEWALVIVGILTLGALAYQANEMRRAAEEMRKSTGAIERQAGIMERQTGVLERSVKAAEDNIQLFIRKERAWISVEPAGELNLSPSALAHLVDYKVLIHGSTEARIVESGAEAYLSDSPEPAPPKAFMFPISMPQMIPPGTLVPVQSAFVVPRIRFDQATIGSIEARKLFVHFRGFVKYKDFFDKDIRETRFQYLWDVTDLTNLRGKPFSRWRQTGGDAENYQT